MRKLLQFTGTLLLASAVVPAWGVSIYQIPATQQEFEEQWSIVPGTDNKTWQWKDATEPYAEIEPANVTNTASVKPDAATALTGTTLVYDSPFEMKAGEIFYFQAEATSPSYSNDEMFYIVIGKDKNDLQPFAEDNTQFKVWGTSYLIKPADSSKSKEYTVPEGGDGMYYIGIRSWYGAGGTDKKLMVKSLRVDKVVDCPAPITGGKAQMDPDGKLEAIVTWTMPTQTKSGAAITDNIGAKIYRSTQSTKAALTDPSALIATLEGIPAGDKVTFADNETNSSTPIPAAGAYYYYIAPFNEEGENSDVTSSTTISLKWVGEDVRVYNPLDFKAAVDGDNIVLTFKNRLEGYNGGYINPEKFYNKIQRSKDGGEFVTIEERFVGEADANEVTTYLDNNLDGFGKYQYRIYSGYGEELSTAQTSSSIMGGGSLSVPFNEDFSTSASFNRFTAESTTSSYGWKYDNGNAKLHPGYSQFSPTTATLFTPPLKLEAGKTYRIGVAAWGDGQSSGGGYYPGYGYGYDDDDYYYGDDDEDGGASYPLSFVVGKEANLASSTEFANKTITATKKGTTLEAFFVPTESGVYYFGLSTTSSDSKCVYLDDLSVDLSVIAPAAVADLSVSPAEDGSNRATVAFTAPVKSNAGVELTNLSKVVVTRYSGETSQEVKVVEDVTPGMSVNFTDEAPEVGLYSYGVVSYIEDNASDESKSEEKWLGYDVPKAISAFNGLQAELNESYIPVISWGALSGTAITEHGGYIDIDNLKYRVYRMDEINGGDPVCVGETGELTFTDSSILEAEWGKYRYGIAVVNGTQEGRKTDCFTTINGGEVDMEHELDLTNDDYVEKALEGRGFIGENGITWKGKGETEGTEHIAYLPPFRYAANETTGVKLDMTLSRGDADFEELMEVYLCSLDAPAPALRNENQSHSEATEIAGHSNMTLIQTIPVHAFADDPEAVSVPVDIAENGKYRLALRCASADNKLLKVHTLAVAPHNNVDTGIETVDMESADSDSLYYTLQGVAVKNPAPGVYIRIKNGKATKIMVRP